MLWVGMQSVSVSARAHCDFLPTTVSDKERQITLSATIVSPRLHQVEQRAHKFKVLMRRKFRRKQLTLIAQRDARMQAHLLPKTTRVNSKLALHDARKDLGTLKYILSRCVLRNSSYLQ